MANYAALADIDPAEAARRIYDSIPPGNRRVEFREVTDAVAKAYKDREGARPFIPVPRAPEGPKADTARLWADCARRYPEDSDPVCELTESSPVRLPGCVEGDAALLLRTRYDGDDILYSGGAKERGIMGQNTQPVRDWLAHAEAGGKLGPHFIPNPLTGCEGTTADGKPTLRGDSCVAAWRYALVEFDGIPTWKQASFWLATRLPVAAVIFSGSKSLHGLLEVNCTTAEQWAREVKPLYRGILKDLGADPACSNAARMSRTPGVARGDDFQRLVWLKGRA